MAVSAWLRLLKAHALIERELRRGLSPRCTFPQFDVLNQLDREPGGLTSGELSRRLLVTAGNLTGIIGRLEREGLLRRAVDPADRRAFRLTVTPRGRRLVRAAQQGHHRQLARLLAVLPPRDLRALQHLLGRLRDGLESRLTARPSPPTVEREV